MNLDKMIEIFLGLLAVVPESLREPMVTLFGEIHNNIMRLEQELKASVIEIGNLRWDKDSDLVASNENIASLEAKLKDAYNTNSVLSDDLAHLRRHKPVVSTTYSSPAITHGKESAPEILRALVTQGYIAANLSAFRGPVLEYYRDTYDGKIPAIAFYRQLTGRGLRESKEQVEVWLAEDEKGRAGTTS